MTIPDYRGRFARLASSALLALFAIVASTAHDAFAQQVVLTTIQGLDFGRFVAGSGGGVIVATSGLRSRSGGVVLLNSPSTRQASFRAARSNNGGANKAVIISLPSNGSTRLASGANSMAVDNFIVTPSSLLSLPTGGATLAVGATLVVAPNQTPGKYAGSFPLIVNFQ